MKTSTLLLFCFLLSSSTALLAKPIRNTFSVPADTLFITAHLETEDCNGNPSPHVNAIDKKEALAATLIPTGDLCGNGTGAIDLTPDPATPGPWQYLWSNGATTQDLTGLSAGTYMVTILDANGNPQQAQTVVVNLPNIAPASVTSAIVGNSNCIAPHNGSIDLTVTPSGPFTYLWSTGATTADISGLDDGLYTISVTFGATCTTTYSFQVDDLANSPGIFPSGTSPSHCELSDGAAAVVPTGGVPPFSYIWSNGSTTQFVANVLQGTYTVTITAANACTATLSLTVDNINWPIKVDDVNILPNTTCIGGNGSIDLIGVGPAVQTFSYLWDNGATTQDLSNLPSGSYRVTISITPACTFTDVYFVEHEPIVPDIALNNTPSTCGFSNGFVNLTALPGQGC